MSKTRRDIARAPALLLQLRDSTRDYHHALDHHPELQRLLRPGLTLNGYRRSLLALHAPQAALEGAVAEGAMYLGQAELLSPCRLPALEADLAALGVAQTDTHLAQALCAPECRRVAGPSLRTGGLTPRGRSHCPVFARHLGRSRASEFLRSFAGTLALA